MDMNDYNTVHAQVELPFAGTGGGSPLDKRLHVTLPFLPALAVWQ